MLHSLTAILPNVENFCGDTNPVEVASQLLGDVGLATGWQANHDYHSGGIGKLRPTRAAGQSRAVVIGKPNLLDAALRQLHGHF